MSKCSKGNYLTMTEDGVTVLKVNPCEGTVSNHPLQEIFDACLDQVTSGKGEERHGKGSDFYDQPWFDVANCHGTGFLSGQAAKKLKEAQGFSGERWEKEMLGAIVYATMAVLHKRSTDG